MSGRMVRPRARMAINEGQAQAAAVPEGPGRFERAAPERRTRAGTGRGSARRVPIRPAAERTHRLLLRGGLAYDTAAGLEATLDELCDAGIGELVIDLGALAGVDTTGMRVLVMRCELCRRRGILVRVERLEGVVLEAFTSAGLLAGLPIAGASAGRPEAAAGSVHENPPRNGQNIV